MLVAVYGEHFGRLLSVEWSATDPDVVFTGSDDHTVHGWHISQHCWNDGELVLSLFFFFKQLDCLSQKFCNLASDPYTVQYSVTVESDHSARHNYSLRDSHLLTGT